MEKEEKRYKVETGATGFGFIYFKDNCVKLSEIFELIV